MDGHSIGVDIECPISKMSKPRSHLRNWLLRPTIETMTSFGLILSTEITLFLETLGGMMSICEDTCFQIPRTKSSSFPTKAHRQSILLHRGTTHMNWTNGTIISCFHAAVMQVFSEVPSVTVKQGRISAAARVSRNRSPMDATRGILILQWLRYALSVSYVCRRSIIKLKSNIRIPPFG